MNYSGYAAIHSQNNPDKVCLIERTPSEGSRKTFTWKEFNDEINRLANYLSKEMGVRHGDYVMHLQNDSLNWMVTYFAIIRLGAIVVPLNFRFESSDIIYAADVCNPKVFIFGSEFLKVVQNAKKDLSTLENYICVGDEIADGMIDFKTIQAYEDISDSMVDVDI